MNALHRIGAGTLLAMLLAFGLAGCGQTHPAGADGALTG
jgi:hypothetical protein